jgi:hypothetical protein
VKKSFQIILDEADVIELMRILLDDDSVSALAFLKKNYRGKARELLEGG